MGEKETPVVKRSLYSWVWSGNVKLQILIVVIIAITVGARLVPLEMQKRIINRAIALKQLDLLYYYCLTYLAAVVTSVGLKYVVTIIQTHIGQRVLARMRKDLYHHILTLPLNFFRKTQPGLVVSALVTEIVTAGEFAGQAIAVPLINLLTLVSFTAYLLYLNWVLALVSLAIYPAILFLVPLLQKKANKANRRRVDETRKVSNRITDTIAGIHEVHGNGSFRIENSKFDVLIDKLFRIRIVWAILQQGAKTTNNFFTSLGPFLVFLLGGYMAMQGRLELGALVAFVSAQERLYDPWKELIAFYQLYQDASVKYQKTMEYFDVESEHALEPKDREPYELTGAVEAENLSFKTSDGISLINDINLSLKPGEHLALVGFSGSGKSTLAQCLGQLYKYTGGHVYLNDKEVAELTKADIVRNMGFVSQSPFIFSGTIKENLLYSCVAVQKENNEGEPENLPTLDDIISVLQQTGVFVDVLRFGLNAILDPKKDEKMVERLIKIRNDFQEDYSEELSDFVEFFNEDRFLYFSSISDNLIFGTPKKAEFKTENLATNKYFTDFLKSADLTRPLLSMGEELVKQTVDILGNLTPDKVFFEQSPIQADELEDYKMLVERLKKKKLHEMEDDDRAKLLEIALRFTPGKHKMIGLPKMLERLILEGRSMFRSRISKDDPGAVSFIDLSEYIFTQTILNNILFGKMKTGRQEAIEKINQSIIQLLIEEDFLETIVEIGMHYDVGSKGENLSGGQRQKLAIARAFLKSPPLMILDEATSALDNKSQTRVQNQLETRWKGRTTVVAVVHRLDITKNYDKIAVMKAGKIVEIGTYDELIGKKGMLHELVYGKN